jgi:myo-inositol-1(or 4)-monophosphatase
MPKDLSVDDLRGVLEFSVALARKAGQLILEGSRAIQAASADAVDEKKNSVDLVTEYDKSVEELVKNEVGRAYADFQLCAARCVCPGPGWGSQECVQHRRGIVRCRASAAVVG